MKKTTETTENHNKKQPELYLVIFWENSNIDINKAKEIIKKYHLHSELTSGVINSNNQLDFIRQLYYESITNFKEKLQRVGCNNILVGIIKDNQPKYKICHTTRGFQKINTNILNLKKKLRSISKVNDGVHISDSKRESKHNLYLCFSKKYDELLNDDKPIIFYPKKFSTFKDVLSLMNESIDYVIQRNFHGLEDSAHPKHTDIDLLVTKTAAAVRLINAKPATNDSTRKKFKVELNQTTYYVEIRDVYENYYDPIWALNILQNKNLSVNEDYFVPSVEDQIYMLAYHALLHKYDLKDDYLKQLQDLTKNNTDRPLNTWDDILFSLQRFLQKKEYRITIPEDKTVKINPFSFRALNICINEKITRNTILPEHHARDISKKIAEDGFVIHKKSGLIHSSSVIAGKTAPLDQLVIKLVQAKDNYFSSYLYNEHYFLNLLGNKYTPTLFGHFISEGWYTLVMERISGASLSYLLEKKQLNKKLFEIIKNELDNILVVFNEKCIHHRDLRLENIFLTNDMKIKVIDFGLATSTYDKNSKLPKSIKGFGDDERDLKEILGILKLNISAD